MRTSLLTLAATAVTVVPAAGIDLACDVARARAAIAAQDGPVVLVAYSGAGAAVSEAGNDPRVQGLVYIAAVVPDAGEAPAADAPRSDSNTITGAAWKTK